MSSFVLASLLPGNDLYAINLIVSGSKSESLTIYGVSLRLDDETGTLYKDAARGELAAHMIHYGETSFATVFTSKEPSIGGLRRILRRRQLEEPYRPSDEDHELIKFEVQQACEDQGIDTEGVVFYLQPMSVEDIERFAQQRLETIEDEQ
jgi:hypothetical protein